MMTPMRQSRPRRSHWPRIAAGATCDAWLRCGNQDWSERVTAGAVGHAGAIQPAEPAPPHTCAPTQACVPFARARACHRRRRHRRRRRVQAALARVRAHAPPPPLLAPLAAAPPRLWLCQPPRTPAHSAGRAERRERGRGGGEGGGCFPAPGGGWSFLEAVESEGAFVAAPPASRAHSLARSLARTPARPPDRSHAQPLARPPTHTHTLCASSRPALNQTVRRGRRGPDNNSLT